MSGGCIDGQLGNDATIIEKDGRHVMFTSQNGYLSIPGNYIQNLTNFSTAFWFNMENNTDRTHFLHMQIMNSGSSFKIKFNYLSGSVTFVMLGNGWEYGFENEHLPDFKLNEWIHVGVICKLNIGIKLYINGCLIREAHERLSSGNRTVSTLSFLYGRKENHIDHSDHITNLYVDDIYFWTSTVPKEYFYILYNDKRFV